MPEDLSTHPIAARARRDRENGVPTDIDALRTAVATHGDGDALALRDLRVELGLALDARGGREACSADCAEALDHLIAVLPLLEAGTPIYERVYVSMLRAWAAAGPVALSQLNLPGAAAVGPPLDWQVGTGVRAVHVGVRLGKQSSNVQDQLRHDELLTQIVDAALRAAEVAGCYLRSGYEGSLAVFPAGIDETVVLPKFLREVGIELRKGNRVLRHPVAVRVALSAGFTMLGPNGPRGAAVTEVHRLLQRECAGLLTVLVGPGLYDDLVAHDWPGLPTDDFQRTNDGWVWESAYGMEGSDGV